MSDFEFIKYDPIIDDKAYGIATVKAFDKIILRYKITKGKNGTGYFANVASYKKTENGQDFYIQSFLLDSRGDEEELNQLVREKVKPFIESEADDAIPFF